MTSFTQHFAAAFAAVFIVSVSFTAVVTVPPVQAQTVAIAPVLA